MDSNLKCRYEHHEDEDILGICVNHECKEPRLFCFLCIQNQGHALHQKDLLRFPEFEIWKIEGKTISDKFYLFINELEKFISLFKKLLINTQMDFNLNVGSVTSNQIELSVNKIIQMKKLSVSFSQDIVFLSKQINEMKKKCKLQISESQKNEQLQFKPESVERIKFTFSDEQKHKSIEIFDEGKTAQMIDIFNKGFCVCNQIIPRDGKEKFTIKIISVGWYIYLGVCRRDAIIKANYNPILTQSGHGCYLICSDGRIFQSHCKEIQNKQESFKFSQNDVVSVKINDSQKLIIWEKQDSNQNFKMYLGQDNEEQDLYPCVIIYGYHSDSVKIIDIK